MPRLMFDPEQYDRVPTNELRSDDVAEGVTLRFDDAGRTEQNLDDDVAEAFIHSDKIQRDLVVFEETDAAGLDDVGELLVGTVDEIADIIEAGAYDDQLDDLEQREAEGDDRVGVQEAIEQRRSEVSNA